MRVSLHGGQSARRASILVVDDEPDVADLFRQRFRREVREGIYVMQRAQHVVQMIGDAVDTASRLQGLTRTLKTPLVVGGPLVDAITNRIIRNRRRPGEAVARSG